MHKCIIVVVFALALNMCCLLDGWPKPIGKITNCTEFMLVIVAPTPEGPLPYISDWGCRCKVVIDGKPYLTIKAQDPKLCEGKDNEARSLEMHQDFGPEFTPATTVHIK